MSTTLERGYVVPNPGPPKTIGILNIVFASLILLMGFCQLGSLFLMPAMRTWMQAQQKKTEAAALLRQKEAIDAQIAELEAKIKEAKADDEKATLQAEIAALRARPKPFTPNVTLGLEMTDDPKYALFSYTDLATSFVLNIAMLVSGIGLIRLHEWGRKTSIWVAVLKIVRAVVLGTFCILILVPMITRKTAQEMDKMGAQIQAQQGNRRGGPPVRQAMKTASAFMGAAMTASYVAMFGAYAIYPAISLFVLTRPRARAACLAPKAESKSEAELLS